jgi:hypothetical protein
MTDAEFRCWLEAEVRGGRMTPQQRDDLLEQKGHFDRHRAEIERQHPQQVVGYVNGTCQAEPTVHRLLDRAKERYPGRMVYFEPVGFDLY